jgi:hypothetical protein
MARPVNIVTFSGLRLALRLHSYSPRNLEMRRSALSNASSGITDRLPGKARMLKIQRSANGEVVFTLIGRIDEEHIKELETIIGGEGKDCHIVLDLKDVTLVGQEGIDFLAQCEADNIRLVNWAPYVREWITRQRNGS